MEKIKFVLLCLIISSGYTQANKSWIRINQLGYTKHSVKVAVFASKEDIHIRSFEIVDVLTDEVAYKSSDVRPFDSYACFTTTYRLDFSAFAAYGTYYIKVGNTRSPRFTISDDIYNGAADFLLKYMRQQRCGYNPFLKDSCHTHDGFIVDHPELDGMPIDVIGGWHDASDYLQYVTTSANATYQMLFAYQENPEAFVDKYNAQGDPGANGIPDILDEAKWGLDWLDKMNPDYGVMFNQIADDRDHRKFTLPTLDSISYGRGLERPVYYVTGKSQGLAKYKNRTSGVSSTAAKYASAFALGSELLKQYYPGFCQKISKKAFDAYKFAKTDLGVCQTACNVSPYFYEEDNYVDDMELAAAQLYNISDDLKFLDEAMYWGDVEPVTPWMIADTARHYQWYPFVNVGHYIIARSADSLKRGKFIRFLKNGIEHVYNRAKKNAFYMGIPFIWCSNNLVAATLTQIRLYKKLTDDKKYNELEASLRDWLFGCNPWGTSMIVGYPEYGDSPVDPHSALTAVFNMKIDGGLVDGPVYTSIFKRLRGLKIVHGDEYAEFQSDLCVYHDDYGDYSTNEPTMDGTASLTFYLSELDIQGMKSSSDKFIRKYGGIQRGDTTSKNIHLVFTGGDYNDGGELIRKTLDNYDIKAHFFFTGDFYRDNTNKNLIKGLINDGHYLGAHSDKHLLYASWDDRDSLLISKDAFIEDLKNNYKEMAKFGITRNDTPFFLPPYEWFNETISQWTKELGLTLINFTPGTSSNADYTTPDMGTQYIHSDKIYQNILNYEENSLNGLNGFILLIHIGTHPDRTDKFYTILSDLVSELQKRGYSFSILK